MEEFLINNGYPALFALSFLASTVLPLGSEWLLVAMLYEGFNPVLAVVAATLGNTLGAATTYAVGKYGGIWFIEKVLHIAEGSRKNAERVYRRYGSWSLLLSWMPFLGDPLCLIAGVFEVSFKLFFVLVILGKLGRYIAVTLITLEVIK